MKIFFDGGCRPNPGPIEVAAVVRGVLHHRGGLGEGTSHEAEWAALLYALEIARSLGETDIVLIGDCANVVAQANGAKCRSPALLAAFRDEARRFARVRVRQVRRGRNLAGIALARLQPAHRLEQPVPNPEFPPA